MKTVEKVKEIKNEEIISGNDTHSVNQKTINKMSPKQIMESGI